MSMVRRQAGWLSRCGVVAVALLLSAPARLSSQPRADVDQYDHSFRKHSKRWFGPGFDWRLFKAQGMAESNLDPLASSRVGARGVMQLMPGTYREIASKNADLQELDDPEMNIAAGIAYDRRLWLRWESDSVEADRAAFMFASYNAGRGTLINAQRLARRSALDPRSWPSIERVAPKVPRWRHGETLEYVRRINANVQQMDDRGHVIVRGVTARGAKVDTATVSVGRRGRRRTR
jgi:membrane-bound lytic murein transglycosylase MltF